MNKLRLLPVLIFGLLAVFVVSCKKDDDKLSGGTGNTDLQVYAVNANQEPIAGALVALYSSEADRDAQTNSISSGTTGNNGFVFFGDLSSLTYYVTVTKELKSGKGDTGVPIKDKEQSALTVVLP
jgi:hypothetical protein